jgi:hypothetical protein
LIGLADYVPAIAVMKMLLSHNSLTANRDGFRNLVAPARTRSISEERVSGELSLKQELFMRGLRQSFVGAVAVVALASVAQAADLRPVVKAPPEPAQQATGYVEVYGGWANTKLTEPFSDPASFDGWALGGAGRANYWFSRDMSVQVDAQAEGTSYDIPGENSRISSHSYLVGGHLSWRNSQQYLFGVFAAAGDAGGGFSPSLRHGLIGAEAQWYWNQFTLYVQGGYDSTFSSFFELDSITPGSSAAPGATSSTRTS